MVKYRKFHFLKYSRNNVFPLTLRLLIYIYIYIYIYMKHPFLMFLDHTQRRTIVGRTPLDEWSARRRDLYLTIHDTHNRQISMPPGGFEPKISAGERPNNACKQQMGFNSAFKGFILWSKLSDLSSYRSTRLFLLELESDLSLLEGRDTRVILS